MEPKLARIRTEGRSWRRPSRRILGAFDGELEEEGGREKGGGGEGSEGFRRRSGDDVAPE